MADIYYLLFIFNKYLQGTVNFLLSTFNKVLLQKISCTQDNSVRRWSRRLQLRSFGELHGVKANAGRIAPVTTLPGLGGVQSHSEASWLQNRLCCPRSWLLVTLLPPLQPVLPRGPGGGSHFRGAPGARGFISLPGTPSAQWGPDQDLVPPLPSW